jgi:hypothetical protein
MRLSNQLSRADHLLNEKKYQKALKAYNAMNIDGLTMITTQLAARSLSATHASATHSSVSAMAAVSVSANVSNVPASVYAFDRLVANLKYQYYHNKGIALLKLHQVVLAIVCFKQAIEQMTLVQVYTVHANTETNTNTPLVTTTEDSLPASPLKSNGKAEREREQGGGHHIKQQGSEDVLRMNDSQYKYCESSAEHLAICYIYAESYTEALTVLHALERLAAEEKLQLLKKKELVRYERRQKKEQQEYVKRQVAQYDGQGK